VALTPLLGSQVTLISYFGNRRRYFALVTTLERAVPRVVKFLLGVLPAFASYVLFGVIFFGSHSVRFSGVRNAMVTLFSLLNGDVLRETFNDLIPFNGLVTEIYLYSFVLIFAYVTLNVLLCIVEECFFAKELWVAQLAASRGGGGLSTPSTPATGGGVSSSALGSPVGRGRAGISGI
jgi:hypothetical protein